MKQELKKWKLAGYYPYCPIFGTSWETGVHLSGIYDEVDAEVPGGVHADLYRAGLIEDPYKDMNSLKAEWIENRWWVYYTQFERQETDFEKAELVFMGIDYKAQIFLNNEKIADAEGMYVPVKLDITKKLKKGINAITVIFENPPQEMGQIGYTSMTHTQKARFNYKWDFSTRMVNIGLYLPVYIEYSNSAKIENFRFETLFPAEKGKALLDMEISGAEKDCFAVCRIAGKTYKSDISNGNAHFEIKIENAKLWWPNGYGKQNLYDLEMEVIKNETVSHGMTAKVGLKTVKLERNENTLNCIYNYTFVINGKKIYCKGLNLTPLDLLYGTVTRKRYENLLKLVKKANVNIVRVWGGGLIESEDFYDLCDRLGIMVWQEFIQSSSGINNVPSKIPEFLKLAERTAEFATKTRRNHVSLTVFAGGNELSSENNRIIEGQSFEVGVDFDDKNIEMLYNVVQKNCPFIPMLPSSPSGDNRFLNIGLKGHNHDVHGPWKYSGVVNHYTEVNNSDSLFHSEFGCDAMSSVSSLKKFLSPKNLNMSTVTENPVWKHHGEWWDTGIYRDFALFGKPADLNDYCEISQFMQAESLRYTLEGNRRRAFNNSGSIIWAGNEPYPNVFNTSVIDYYNTPKKSYKAVTRAFAKINPSIKYDKLLWNCGEDLTFEVYATNDDKVTNIEIECEIYADDSLLEKRNFSVECGNGLSASAGKISLKVPEALGITVCLKARAFNKVYENAVYFLIKQKDGYASIQGVKNFNKKYL